MIQATVTVDLGPLRQFKSALESDLRLSSNGPIRKAFKQWGARYRSFLRERFSRLSRGGGEWPSLAASTLKNRRGKFQKAKVQKYLKVRIKERKQLNKVLAGKSKATKEMIIRGFNQITHEDTTTLFGARASILIDTGTLFASLDPIYAGKPGQYEEQIPFGIKVGYGGRQLHPGASGKAALTIEQIAEFHQLGGPHLPIRRIVVPPDDETLAGMTKDMQRAINDLARQTRNQ